jgi:hypothetical protein
VATEKFNDKRNLRMKKFELEVNPVVKVHWIMGPQSIEEDTRRKHMEAVISHYMAKLQPQLEQQLLNTFLYGTPIKIEAIDFSSL